MYPPPGEDWKAEFGWPKSPIRDISGRGWSYIPTVSVLASGAVVNPTPPSAQLRRQQVVYGVGAVYIPVIECEGMGCVDLTYLEDEELLILL